MARTKRVTPEIAGPDGSATVTGLMMAIESEIAGIKDGTISEPKARVIAKNRQMQQQCFGLILAAAKIEARYRPEMARRLGLPTPSDGIEVKARLTQ